MRFAPALLVGLTVLEQAQAVPLRVKRSIEGTPPTATLTAVVSQTATATPAPAPTQTVVICHNCHVEVHTAGAENATSSTTSSAPAESTTAAADDNGSDGLSTGDVVGIFVGVGIAGTIAFGAAIHEMGGCRRKRSLVEKLQFWRREEVCALPGSEKSAGEINVAEIDAEVENGLKGGEKEVLENASQLGETLLKEF